MNGENLEKNPFKKSGAFLSRFAEQIGGRLPRLPDKVSKDTIAHQGLLRRFQNRLALNSGILEAEDSRMQKARSTWTAYSMVDDGLADEETVVEMRLLLPEESLENSGMIAGSVEKMAGLKEVLAEEYGICAVPNSHPIMPTKTYESDVSPESVWGTISDELESFDRQMHMEPARRQLAVLAITEASYARNIFGGQVFFEDEKLASNQLMVLRHVGQEPRENLLLPPPTTGILESRELELARSQGQADQAEYTGRS